MHRWHWQTHKCTLINAQTIVTCVRCYKDICAYIFLAWTKTWFCRPITIFSGRIAWASEDPQLMIWEQWDDGCRKVVWEKYFSERNRSPLSYSTWSSSTWSEGGECCKTLYFSYMLCFPSFLFVFFSNLSICHLFSPLFLFNHEDV